jgi:predicted HD superfamily hydrolase involved in NAD metabolism
MHSTYKTQLKELLSAKRFEHSVYVARIARELAKVYELELAKAETAALLHDCAKTFPDHVLYAKAIAYKLVLDPIEKQNPKLLHAKVGCKLAEKLFGIKDKAILSAIAKHTTGDARMSLLEKIVYVADYLDPHDKYPQAKQIRKTAYLDIDLAVCLTSQEVLRFLLEHRLAIHPKTLACWNYYVKAVSK